MITIEEITSAGSEFDSLFSALIMEGGTFDWAFLGDRLLTTQAQRVRSLPRDDRHEGGLA